MAAMPISGSLSDALERMIMGTGAWAMAGCGGTMNLRDGVDGKMIRLSAGMNITAEIKTGQRRVIAYLPSPVQRAGSESWRER